LEGHRGLGLPGFRELNHDLDGCGLLCAASVEIFHKPTQVDPVSVLHFTQNRMVVGKLIVADTFKNMHRL